MTARRPRPVGINHVALQVDDLQRALAFWRALFGEIDVDVSERGMAFVDLGDQFVALAERGASGAEPHFGLVVDDKEAARQTLTEIGAETGRGRFLDTRDPSGNLIQIVQYDQIQFTKAPEVLRAMALELTKTAAALEELRANGISP